MTRDLRDALRALCQAVEEVTGPSVVLDDAYASIRRDELRASSAIPRGWQGEVCCRCGRHNAVGFSVPDNVWAAVMGVTEEIVCLACFDAEAAVIGLAWEDSVELYPCSTAGWASTS